jgi:hypothetical protein
MVFSCTKGTVDLEKPIALAQAGSHMRFAADWTEPQRDLVRQLQPMALSQWWQPNHVNWDLLEWDSEVYKASGQLVKANLVLFHFQTHVCAESFVCSMLTRISMYHALSRWPVHRNSLLAQQSITIHLGCAEQALLGATALFSIAG